MSNVIAGLGLLLVCLALLGLIPLLFAMFREWSDHYVLGILFAVVAGLILGCVLMIAGIAFGGAKPELVEGHCYQAVKHGHTVPIVVSTGKSTVVVPSYTESIDLVEVRCVD